MKENRRRKKISGPLKTLLFLVAATLLLLGFDRIRLAREIALATGPTSQNQRNYFIESADRPGIELFYKGLTTAQKVTMAKRLGAYADEKAIVLTTKLLSTFDKAAFEELSKALAVQAKRNPEDMVKQINTGATQPKIAIGKALLSATPGSYSPLAQALNDPALRGNAKRLLLEAGAKAEPQVRQIVASKDADARREAISLLGQYRREDSLGVLGKGFRNSKPPERTLFLSAIVSIGAPKNRQFFENVFALKGFTQEERILAAQALARIGTLQSTAPLARALLTAKGQERIQVLDALAEAGEKVLSLTTLKPADRLHLATLIRGPRADALLSSAIRSSGQGWESLLRACNGREGLTPALTALATKLDPKKQSAKIVKIMETLNTTRSGQKELKKLEAHPKIGGLAMRTLRLSANTR